MTTEGVPNPDDLCDNAQAHHRAGRLSEAEALYQNILQIDPGHPGALYFLGGIAYGDGRYALAFKLINELINDQPNDVEALHLQGLIACKLEQHALAVDLIGRALALHSAYPQAHHSLGYVLQVQGKLDAAIASFRRALVLNPNYAEAYCGVGNILKIKNNLDEAALNYRQALALKPDLDFAHNGLGQVLHMQGRLDEAIASYRRALVLKPDSAELQHCLGGALLAQGRVEEAIVHYRNALLLAPDSAELHNNLGVALAVNGNLSEAVASYRQALLLKPNDAEKLLNFSQVLVGQGDIKEAIDCMQQVLALKPDHAAAYSCYLALLQYLPDYSPQKLRADHVLFGARFEAPLRAAWPLHTNKKDSQRRLKVGFVSGDLGMHPVGFFLEGALKNIDRQQLDITLYPTSDIADVLTDRLRALGFAWTPLLGLSDTDAAARIRADQIDILVDLSGHTKDNRLLVFARKPAPVQVAWLGYWATTGLQAIDYILCDRYGIPAGEVDFYVEKPYYLPDTRLCFTPPTDNISVYELPALSNGYITFGCFNNLAKMTAAVVALWARILHGVPNARLLLKSRSFADLAMQQAVLTRFAAHGITAERLLLDLHSARAEYFSAYHRVDIALDPFPFTGGTTSIEGLWMGVPMITRRGDRMIAHQGESILHNMGLPDWIANDDEAYVALAITHANNLAGLAELRTQLRPRLLASPLCNAIVFTRNLEFAFQAMWKTYCETT